jgi:hypothetical protein
MLRRGCRGLYPTRAQAGVIMGTVGPTVEGSMTVDLATRVFAWTGPKMVLCYLGREANAKPGLTSMPGFAIDQLIICGRKGPANGVLITSPAGIIYARFTHNRWKREYNGFGPAWHFLYVPPNSPCIPRWPAISQPLRRQGLFLSKRGPAM